MSKYLLFRTDRIGDFLLALILIKAIQNNDSHAHITVIASEKNYEYIKNSNTVDNVILLKNKFLSKIKLIYTLKKKFFDNIIIHDNKKRSKIISFFKKKKKELIFPSSKTIPTSK